jgi:hypothetical protein
MSDWGARISQMGRHCPKIDENPELNHRKLDHQSVFLLPVIEFLPGHVSRPEYAIKSNVFQLKLPIQPIHDLSADSVEFEYFLLRFIQEHVLILQVC